MPMRPHRFSAIIAALALSALCAMPMIDPVFAQDATPAPAGPAWTDPPDRKTAPSPAAGREDAKPEDVRKADATARVGKAPRNRRDAATGPRPSTASRHASRKAPAQKVARRTVPAGRESIRPVAVRAPASRMARDGAWTVRAFQPNYEDTPGYRYGYLSEEGPIYRRRDDGGRDYQAARLRQAREAGYLVVRTDDPRTMRGRSFETLRESEDRGDPED
ncbi:hypothetical protein FPV16_25330 [Methylobacterium sp. W2]|uniref:hypothetical protein n=1 Tax=Methylobacterium sp. W2 TaxID=2598107 RepID=UPI001D0C51D3|nr:hypothetical protein [Methylobacterium sp. W2]MCC0809481.1 hypothetical protein [Methylobacterium sp. W2]